MTLADKIKELRDLRKMGDPHVSYYLMHSAIPRLLDCLEIQSSALNLVIGNLIRIEEMSHRDQQIYMECNRARAKVNLLFSSEANTNHSARRGNE